jgi:hypothetical protein
MTKESSSAVRPPSFGMSAARTDTSTASPSLKLSSCVLRRSASRSSTWCYGVGQDSAVRGHLKPRVRLSVLIFSPAFLPQRATWVPPDHFQYYIARNTLSSKPLLDVDREAGEETEARRKLGMDKESTSDCKRLRSSSTLLTRPSRSFTSIWNASIRFSRACTCPFNWFSSGSSR